MTDSDPASTDRAAAGFESRPPILGAGAELERFLEARGERPYRARQIRRWIYRRRAESFDAMSDLPAGLRHALARAFRPLSGRVLRATRSADGTSKLLIGLDDSESIEAVRIEEGRRATACVSSQAGCPVGCPFCASGLDGVRRNLEVHEIVEQALRLQREGRDGPDLTHLVFMGMGEPLLNFDHVAEAIRELHDPDRIALGARRITVSTVGPRGKIERLARLPHPVNLAISLHAPDDELRDRLVPGNSGVRRLVETAVRYRDRTGRQVTFEYVLLGGVNATPGHAHELARLVRGTGCSVNLIPFNPVAGTGFSPPSPDEVAAFREVLRRRRVPVTIRKRKGRSIDAACGQLRRVTSHRTAAAADQAS